MLGLIYSLIISAGKLLHDNAVLSDSEQHVKAAANNRQIKMEAERQVYKHEESLWKRYFDETRRILERELSAAISDQNFNRRLRLSNLSYRIEGIRHNKTMLAATRDIDRMYRSFLQPCRDEYISLMGEPPVWDIDLLSESRGATL
jgi:hypothetical protein